MILLELDDKQAEFIRLCQDNFTNIMVLKQGKVFDMKSGSAILNIDSSGIIRTVDLNYSTYRYADNA